MMRRGPRRQAGFIITLEFILFTTIVVIGSFVGIAAVRNGLIKLINARAATVVVVYDSAAPPNVIGRAINFDPFEAPQIVFLTPDPSDVTMRLRLLLGVRTTTFTSRTEVFFDAAGCVGTPYVADPGIIPVIAGGPVSPPEPFGTSYLYAMQESGGSGSLRRVNYAVGPGNIVYRTPPVIPPAGGAVLIGSVWRSQWEFDPNFPLDVSPCFTFGAAVLISPLHAAVVVADPDFTGLTPPFVIPATWPPSATVITPAVPEDFPLQTVGTPFPDPIPPLDFPDATPEDEPPLPPVP